MAKQFRVSLATAQRWIVRAKDLPLDQVKWSDESHAPETPPKKTSVAMQQLISDLRKELADNSILGDRGALAIFVRGSEVADFEEFDLHVSAQFPER